MSNNRVSDIRLLRGAKEQIDKGRLIVTHNKETEILDALDDHRKNVEYAPCNVMECKECSLLSPN